MHDGFEHGEYLYHYTTREAAFTHIIPSQKLRFSPFGKMRDPLENKPWLFQAATFNADLEKFDQAYAQFTNLANTILQAARLLSMTIDSDDADNAEEFGRGWTSASMWERYAEHHAGVCLVFKREALIDALSNSLYSMGFPLPYHQRVEYTQAGPRAKFLTGDDLPTEISFDHVSAYVEQRHDDYFCTKTLDWSNEREYRFVVTQPDEIEGELHVDFGDSLEAVVMGERFSHWQRKAVVHLCGARNIDVLQLNWSMARPLLFEYH